MITAILVVNNLRDIDSDRAVSKKTLAVRLGRRGTRTQFLVCLLGAYAVPLALWLLGIATAWTLVSWLSIPVAARLARFIWRESGRPLNQALAGAGRLTLIYALLFSAGIIMPVISG